MKNNLDNPLFRMLAGAGVLLIIAIVALIIAFSTQSVLSLVIGIVLMVIAIIGVGYSFVKTAQQHQKLEKTLLELQAEVSTLQLREDETILRTRKLARALHDLRNAIAAMKLSVHILQRVAHEDEQKFIQRMDEALLSAMEHVSVISAIQAGRTTTQEIAQYITETASLVRE